jgi:Kinase binding protein CGI-121
VLAVKVISHATPDEEQSDKVKVIADHLQTHVAGQLLELDDNNLSACRNLANIHKTYKTSTPGSSKKSSSAILNGTGPSPAQIQELERIVIGMMAIKGS